MKIQFVGGYNANANRDQNKLLRTIDPKGEFTIQSTQQYNNNKSELVYKEGLMTYGDYLATPYKAKVNNGKNVNNGQIVFSLKNSVDHFIHLVRGSRMLSEKGIIHNEISLDNIVVTGPQTAKYINFHNQTSVSDFYTNMDENDPFTSDISRWPVEALVYGVVFDEINNNPTIVQETMKLTKPKFIKKWFSEVIAPSMYDILYEYPEYTKAMIQDLKDTIIQMLDDGYKSKAFGTKFVELYYKKYLVTNNLYALGRVMMTLVYIVGYPDKYKHTSEKAKFEDRVHKQLKQLALKMSHLNPNKRPNAASVLADLRTIREQFANNTINNSGPSLNKNKNQLQGTQAQCLKSNTLADLKIAAKSKGLPVSGTKAELCTMLLATQSNKSKNSRVNVSIPKKNVGKKH